MESVGELFSGLFSELMTVWGEIFSAVWEILPKIFSFILWALVGIVVLPALFIAGTIYPKWVDWGEGF